MLEKLIELTRWQALVVLFAAVLGAGALELMLRARWTPPRLKLMNAQFIALRNAVVVTGVTWLVQAALLRSHAPEWLEVAVAFGTVMAGMTAVLRVARVLLFQWLFVRSAHEGVPVLLVDLSTIAGAIVLFGALLHAVFLIELASLLATSAVLSVVLGLALQDTLGQLFAGISLQLDRPFRLGDWVEVRSGGDRFSGQVQEVSWRATVLLAIGEELITIPNKTMAQGLVSNFSGRERPFVRGYVFRLPLDVDVAKARDALTRAALETDGIVHQPAPVALIIETTESWLVMKLIAFTTDFGNQFTIGDAVQRRALELLAEQGIALASARLTITGRTE